MDIISDAIAKAGSQAALAQISGCSQPAVHKWLAGKARPGPKAVLAIESRLEISRHDLRPDIYPREDWCGCPACTRERDSVATA